jgi:hypothetical protein
MSFTHPGSRLEVGLPQIERHDVVALQVARTERHGQGLADRRPAALAGAAGSPARHRPPCTPGRNADISVAERRSVTDPNAVTGAEAGRGRFRAATAGSRAAAAAP